MKLNEIKNINQNILKTILKHKTLIKTHKTENIKFNRIYSAENSMNANLS